MYYGKSHSTRKGWKEPRMKGRKEQGTPPEKENEAERERRPESPWKESKSERKRERDFLQLARKVHTHGRHQKQQHDRSTTQSAGGTESIQLKLHKVRPCSVVHGIVM